MRAFAAFAFVALFSGVALADAPPKNVVVVIAGDANHTFDGLLRERVSSAGAELGLERTEALDPTIFLAPPERGTRALAHIWIDATSPDRFTLLLLDEALKRGLIRYVSRDRGDEIAREEVGHIVQSAVEALLAGEVIGVTREELGPTRPTPKPVEPAPPPTRRIVVRVPTPPVQWSVSAAGSYELDVFARDLYAHGPGLMFDVRRDVEPSFSLGVRLEAQARFPLDVEAPLLAFRIDSWTARVLGLVSMHATPSWSAEAALGGGLDLEHVVPTVAQAGAMLAASSVRAAFVLRAGLWFARTQPLRVALGVVVDIDTSGATFDAIEGGTRRTLFAANLIRPGVVIEVGR